MSLNKLALSLSLALFALPMSAMAQDAAAETGNPAQSTGEASAAPAAEVATSPLTWNLSLTSDYVFRGITQTNFGPAVQGGLDYSFGDSGFAVGTWASNVDFNDSDGPNIELDTYVGWSKAVGEGFNLSLSLVRYNYFGSSNGYGDVDYNEFIAKGTLNEAITFTYAYANNYANAGFSSSYVNIGGTWAVGNDFSVNAGVGHTKFSDGNGTYNDFNVGISRQFGPVKAALNYYDATGNVIDGLYGSHSASDHVVLSFAFGG